MGGGYIGLEMAEAYIERGCTATVVERAAEPLQMLDPDFGARVREKLTNFGCDVLTSTKVARLRARAGC